MKKILNLKDSASASKKAKELNKKIVLAGGCFDVLHIGHILFLEKAKKAGDLLIILLESDENIKKRKGNNRPINSQKNRAIVLSALSSVDFIIPLKGVTKDQEYDRLMVQINPDVIALTKGDKNIKQRKMQCERIFAKMIQIEKVKGISSSDFIKNN